MNSTATALQTSWTFPSSSGSGTYTAKIAGDGKLMCNCRGWTMRKGESARQCKHTKQIVSELQGTVVARGEFTYLTREFDKAGAAARVAIKRAEAIAPQAPAPQVAAPQERVKPMLASAMCDPVVKGPAFDARFNSADWVMEEKLDGHRVIAIVKDGTVQAHSRPRADGDARSRELPAHIVDQLQRLPNGTYDGELLAVSGKSWDVTSGGSGMVFIIFDLLDVMGIDCKPFPYDKRREGLLHLLSALPAGQKAITSVLSKTPAWADVQAIWQRGGEGAVLKRRSSPYRPGLRSPDWIKVKAIASAVLTITGFEAGKTGPYSTVALIDDDGKRTTAKTIDNATMRDIAKDPSVYIGKRLIVSYQEKTPNGSYRHIMWDHIQ